MPFGLWDELAPEVNRKTVSHAAEHAEEVILSSLDRSAKFMGWLSGGTGW